MKSDLTNVTVTEYPYNNNMCSTYDIGNCISAKYKIK